MLSTKLVVAVLSGMALGADLRDLNGTVWQRPLNKRQTTWNPPTNLVQPLSEVWDHALATYNGGDLFGFKNYGYDIIIANQGSINFCVRWDSSATVTAAQRTSIENSLQSNVKKWTDNLAGFMGWPYSIIPVKVVGWAVKSSGLLQGSTSDIDVYTSTDGDGIPECDPRCGRFFHQDNNYGSCPGGSARHYDMSLWLTAGMTGGAGGDWGQRVGSEYFLSAIDSPHIWLHEFGHTLALQDFYDWLPTGQTNFIMNAGSSTVITTFDIWMMRDFWRHLASRYVSTTSTTTTTLKTSTTATTTLGTSTSTTSAPSPSTSGTVARYGQCGGIGWTGGTNCISPYTCKFMNDWYSQCL